MTTQNVEGRRSKVEGTEPIDIEAKVTRIEAGHAPELERAKKLAERVMTQRKEWIAKWADRLIDRKAARIEELPASEFCTTGSCRLLNGEREIAKFVVRFDSEKVDAEVMADWPREDAMDGMDGRGKIETGRHVVKYECIAGRVDWACDELVLEGTSGSVEEMKRYLVARYGMRWNFVRV